MGFVNTEHKKDGWHWTGDDGTKGGPFDTQDEAMHAGYDKMLAAEAKAAKTSKDEK